MDSKDRKIYEFVGFKKRGEWWDDGGDDSIPQWEMKIDLNFIEKYVIPRLDYVDIHIANTEGTTVGYTRIVEVWKDGKGYRSYLKDLTTAFKEALYKLMEVKGD